MEHKKQKHHNQIQNSLLVDFLHTANDKSDKYNDAIMLTIYTPVEIHTPLEIHTKGSAPSAPSALIMHCGVLQKN